MEQVTEESQGMELNAENVDQVCTRWCSECWVVVERLNQLTGHTSQHEQQHADSRCSTSL